LRYDPFDLSRLEVWFQDTFIEVAQPDRVVTTIHPDVEPDPVAAAPPDEGLDYLALLRAEREHLLREQLQGIRFSQLSPEEPDDQSQ
jgi:hypothetical protein